MFNSLSGLLNGKEGNRVFLLNPSGIEWDIAVSLYTVSHLPSPGEQCRIFTYLHHREDILQLFGFVSRKERQLFEELITVSGVGPRAALKILSASEPDMIVASLEQEDVTALSKLPGIGKKTAQKIILQLKGKLQIEENYSASGGENNQTILHKELQNSLTDMGFDSKKTKAVLEQIFKENPSLEENEIFRKAIVELSS